MQLLKKLLLASSLLFAVSNQASATLLTWHLEFVVDTVQADFNYPRDSYTVPAQGDIFNAVITYDTDIQPDYGDDSLSVYTDNITVDIPELTTDAWRDSQQTELRDSTSSVAVESTTGGYFAEKLEIYFADSQNNFQPPTNWHTTTSQINFFYYNFIETFDTPPWRDAQLLVTGHARSIELLNDVASVPESSSIGFLMIALAGLVTSSRLRNKA